MKNEMIVEHPAHINRRGVMDLASKFGVALGELLLVDTHEGVRVHDSVTTRISIVPEPDCLEGFEAVHFTTHLNYVEGCKAASAEAQIQYHRDAGVAVGYADCSLHHEEFRGDPHDVIAKTAEAVLRFLLAQTKAKKKS